MRSRQSNLELFRVIAMMGIVAYHAALYSGLAARAYADPWCWCNAILLLLGAWGKTGINCFVLITGYFMCERKLTLSRILKVIGLTEFYAFAIWGLTLIFDWQQFSWAGVCDAGLAFFSGMNWSFVPSYIGLLLLVPVLNKVIVNLDAKAHLVVVGILLFVLCILPSTAIKISIGEIPWFVTLYLVAAFVRRFENDVGGILSAHTTGRNVWTVVFVLSLIVAAISMAVGAWLNPRMPGRNMIYYWIFPEVKVLAFGVAFCAFMAFKNLRIGSSRLVNTLGGATFGIYLMHDGVLGNFRGRVWAWLINAGNCGGGADFDTIRCGRGGRVRRLRGL